MLQFTKGRRRLWLKRAALALVLLGIASWIALDWFLPARVPTQASGDAASPVAAASATLTPAAITGPVASSTSGRRDGKTGPRVTRHRPAKGRSAVAGSLPIVAATASEPSRLLSQTAAAAFADAPGFSGAEAQPAALANRPGESPAAPVMPLQPAPATFPAQSGVDIGPQAGDPAGPTVLLPPPLALLVAACAVQQRLLQAPLPVAAAAGM